MQALAATKVVGLVMCRPLGLLVADMRVLVEALSSLTPIVLSSFVAPLKHTLSIYRGSQPSLRLGAGLGYSRVPLALQ